MVAVWTLVKKSQCWTLAWGEKSLAARKFSPEPAMH